MEDPESQLEQGFIDEFLRTRGYTVGDLSTLPDDQRRRLMTAASSYAAGKLAQVEARARLVHDLHHQE